MPSRELRHRKIQELVGRHEISTQAELVEQLCLEGFRVTQATVSRDINELRLVRAPLGHGKHKYALAPMQFQEDVLAELKRRFEDNFIRDVDRGENILVLNTAEGYASGIALLIDKWGPDQIVGTLAGEDTILVVARTTKEAVELQDAFEGYIV